MMKKYTTDSTVAYLYTRAVTGTHFATRVPAYQWKKNQLIILCGGGV